MNPPRTLSFPAEVVATSPALKKLRKPLPTISNVASTLRSRPPRSNAQPPEVTSTLALSVTSVAVHGPLGAAHNTAAVFAAASAAQVRGTAAARGGAQRSALSRHETSRTPGMRQGRGQRVTSAIGGPSSRLLACTVHREAIRSMGGRNDQRNSCSATVHTRACCDSRTRRTHPRWWPSSARATELPGGYPNAPLR